MKYFSTFFFILIFNHVFALKNISNSDIVDKIKILDSLERNFLISSSNKDFHNLNKNEYYSFELFENKLHKIPWIDQNSDHEILFAFFKELYFNNNDKLNHLFSCFSYYSITCDDFVKNSVFPEYLMLLPAVLTGYNYKYSTSKGSGMWRLNYATGIWNKLEINDWYDERYHSYKSSYAAYNYIEHLQAIYKNFDYTLCAYLSSPVLVNNWLKGLKKDEKFIDFISKDIYLDLHFFKTLVFIYYLRDELGILPTTLLYPLKTDSVYIHKRFHFEPIISGLNMTAKEFEFLNPQYKFNYSKDSNYIIIPSQLIKIFRSKENEIIYQNDSLYFPEKVNIDTTIDNISENVYYIVKKGVTLSQIAQKYKGVTVDDIVHLNGLKSPDKVKDGKKLIIIKNQ